jgi:hypothetical protein
MIAPPGQAQKIQREVTAKVRSIRTESGQNDHDKRVKQDAHLNGGRSCRDELPQRYTEQLYENDDHQL